MSNEITVENLGKKYLLSHQTQRQSYVALRDVIAERANELGRRLLRPFSSAPRTPDPSREEFWALKDVSFEIKQGERVGIIGRNGAGKSTLLKILSRIIEPTTGRVRIKGRVASLLEVGTGFHPELTGRENIFLNGAILGMTRAEIKKKFDEIVDFAEIEKFLDTPVKRYSSGMYVRLAFAVAAHLEPEILLVDEVLAVGDAQFQKKCLGKMEEVGEEGRTVIFVSHNMAAVQNLCNKGVYLQNGRVIRVGDISGIVTSYMSESTEERVGVIDEAFSRKGNGTVRFAGYRFLNGERTPVSAFQSGEDCVLELTLHNLKHLPPDKLHVSVGIDDVHGVRVTYFSSDIGFSSSKRAVGEARIVYLTVPNLPLADGRYFFTLFCKAEGEISDWVQRAGFFDVEWGDFYNNGKVFPKGQGHFLLGHSFDFC